jgi:hypothetical protein
METSLMVDDVDLIATIVEDQLSDVWENVENHRASILEKIQEVKTVLEQVKGQNREATTKYNSAMKEGVLMGEIVQITM